MKYRYAVLAGVFLLLATFWLADRSRLQSRIVTLESGFAEQEMRQDAAELRLFNQLTPGQTVDTHPDIHFLADDIIRPGHSGFDYCTAFLAEQFSDASDSFDDCEIFVFDVSLDAVPFRGGSYWIVTRDNAILLAFQFEATIGG